MLRELNKKFQNLSIRATRIKECLSKDCLVVISETVFKWDLANQFSLTEVALLAYKVVKSVP